MAKTVYDNAGVAHAWARGASEARSLNGNFYSNGRKLYSYGSHFVIGVRMGVDCFALNSDSYSMSTSRQQSEARNAAHGTIYYLPEMTELADTLSIVAETLNEYRKPSAYIKARLRTYLVKNVAKLNEEAATWLAGLAGLRGGAVERARIERARIDAAEAKRIAAKKREAARNRAIWLADKTPAEWRETIRKAAAAYDGVSAVEAFATELRRARIVAKKDGLSAKRLNSIRAKLAYLETCDMVTTARIAQRQKDKRAYVADVRAWMNASDERRATLSASALNGLAYAANRLARLVRQPLQSSLLRLEADLRTEATSRAERESEAYEAAREADRIARELGHVQAKAAWLDGSGSRGGYRFCDETGLGALLRAVDVKRDDAGVIVGGTLETSHGADVPLTHAIKAFRFVKLIRASGDEWQRNGRTVRVGHYQIDRVDSEGFTAGCHRINWPEIERVARRLGVFDAAPCDAREPSAVAA